MLESDSESAKNLCWRRQVVPKTLGTPLSDLATGGTIPSHGEEGEGGDKNLDVEEVRESEPLAVVLVNAIFHLLFLPEFTIEDPKIDFNEVNKKYKYLISVFFCNFQLCFSFFSQHNYSLHLSLLFLLNFFKFISLFQKSILLIFPKIFLTYNLFKFKIIIFTFYSIYHLGGSWVSEIP